MEKDKKRRKNKNQEKRTRTGGEIELWKPETTENKIIQRE